MTARSIDARSSSHRRSIAARESESILGRGRLMSAVRALHGCRSIDVPQGLISTLWIVITPSVTVTVSGGDTGTLAGSEMSTITSA
jgi:hypothetical protein